MIRHLVHIRFKGTASNEEKTELYAELAGLSEHIDGILDFQYRINVSVEAPLVRGFMDMFWFDFRDEGVRTAYLEDAIHQAIGGRIVNKVEGGTDGIFVCDIEV